MTDTDIVVRLRLEACSERSVAGSDVCVEAAAEIEHLREALAFAQAALMTIKGTLEPEPRAQRGGQEPPDGPPFRLEDVAPNTPR